MIGNTKFLCQVTCNSFEWNHRNTLLTTHWQKTIQNRKRSILFKSFYNSLLSRLVKDDKTETISLKRFYTLINTHHIERFFLPFIVHLVFVLKSTQFLPMNQMESFIRLLHSELFASNLSHSKGPFPYFLEMMEQYRYLLHQSIWIYLLKIRSNSIISSFDKGVLIVTTAVNQAYIFNTSLFWNSSGAVWFRQIIVWWRNNHGEFSARIGCRNLTRIFRTIRTAYFLFFLSPLCTNMNQILANKLNEEGAIILILNMQVGAEVGLDYNSWLAGKEFMGFKMVSPGFHCLFYRYSINLTHC